MMLAFIFSLYCRQNASAFEIPEGTVPFAPQPEKQDNQASIEAFQKMYQARMNHKYVFIFFYESGNSDCDLMSKRLDELVKNNTEKVELIKIDRKDPANLTFIVNMRALTAPTPLTILKDPKGRVVNAFKTVASEEDLKYAFPSPKKEESFDFLQEGKSLIICFTRNDMASGEKIKQSCQNANEKLEGKAAYIEVDVSDPKEAGFLREMKINPDSPEPTTVVVNSKRQISGTFNGEVGADDLVLAATKIVAGGCSPAGGEKSCGPPQTKTP